MKEENMTIARYIKFAGKSVKCLAPLVLATFISGCAGPNLSMQIGNFSTATILTADNTRKAFQLVEDNYYREQVSRLAFNSHNTNKFEKFELDSIKPFISTNALQVRLNILNALTTYAANLSALVGNSSHTNLDQETTAFAGALTTLDTNLVGDLHLQKEVFSPGEIQIFTTAINAIGNWLISYKQEKDAQKAILAMQKPVADICRLFQKDFAILRDQFSEDAALTFAQDRQYILDHNAQFENTPGEKRAVIEMLAEFTQQSKSDLQMLDAMPLAVSKLAQAQTALGQAVSGNKPDNLDSLINELSAEAQRVSKYYRSLKNNK
jgi:HPt (histidine-containing phosphotransfer) domain-containing protein